jgi:hypothetical protein
MSYSARLRPPSFHLPFASFLTPSLTQYFCSHRRTVLALRGPRQPRPDETRWCILSVLCSRHTSLIPVFHLICNILCSCSPRAASTRLESCTTAEPDLVPLRNLCALAPPRMLYDILSNSTGALLRSNISLPRRRRVDGYAQLVDV